MLNSFTYEILKHNEVQLFTKESLLNVWTRWTCLFLCTSWLPCNGLKPLHYYHRRRKEITKQDWKSPKFLPQHCRQSSLGTGSHHWLLQGWPACRIRILLESRRTAKSIAEQTLSQDCLWNCAIASGIVSLITLTACASEVGVMIWECSLFQDKCEHHHVTLVIFSSLLLAYLSCGIQTLRIKRRRVSKHDQSISLGVFFASCLIYKQKKKKKRRRRRRRRRCRWWWWWWWRRRRLL